jgi:hypothetical protein
MTATAPPTRACLHLRRTLDQLLSLPIFSPLVVLSDADLPLFHIFRQAAAVQGCTGPDRSDRGEEIKAGKVKVSQGDAAEAAQILDPFDRYEPARNVTIPTLHD